MSRTRHSPEVIADRIWRFDPFNALHRNTVIMDALLNPAEARERHERIWKQENASC